ncbi:hypothetical protein AXG93_1278s1080 [Marchantia polymorpha subsp. ruderalis]|uniref:AP2/ERF domain-containing protein n=1 Tax=Marchantia polymorpha subsp. ruderalis TaxID=1480154 RepID=A0A176WSY0_MARPO|nr:hypothetical protein AXG93_1278s1080 [Marchantia polymorpha subsp. ruderalis]
MARRRLVTSEAAQQRATGGNIVDRNLRPYKGVTFSRRTGRWEANLWFENKQHYLGASFSALEAARAYDKGILFTCSSTAQLNFDRKDYKEDLRKMRGMSFIKYRQYLRDTSRKAKCKLVNKSLKGILIDEHGKWEVKYCLRYLSKPKYVLIGWFDNEEEALRAYNETALKYDDDRAIIRSFYPQKKDHSNRVSLDKRALHDHKDITCSSATESLPLRATRKTTPDDSENDALAVVPFEELHGEHMVVDNDNLEPALRITLDDPEKEALAVVPFMELDREDIII